MMKKKSVGGESFPFPIGKLPPQHLSRLLKKYSLPDRRVVVGPGIGRDAAVISFPGKFLVAKTDPITFAADEIGWYAVHVNANDVAAMGGTPRWFLATLLLPPGKNNLRVVERIFSQMAQACRDLGAVLCGGHTEITHGLERPIVVGQMLGEVEEKSLVVPERVRPGDDIILTKGLALEGTSVIARERPQAAASLGRAWARRSRELLLNPGISIVREARIINKIAPAHAMHDPTEGGLATGLYEIAAAAGVGLVVDMGEIPILPETAAACRLLNLDPLGLLASGALIAVLPPENSGPALRELQKAGISAAVIGKITPRQTGIKIRVKGKSRNLPRFTRDEITKLF